MADNSRHIAYFWPVWIVAVVFGVCVTQSYEPYGISVAVLSLLLVVSKPKVSFTALDIVVVAWWLFEGLSLLTSINNISVFAAFQKTTLVAVYYSRDTRFIHQTSTHGTFAASVFMGIVLCCRHSNGVVLHVFTKDIDGRFQ